MKKNYLTRLGRIPQRTVVYLLLSILFATILFYSCRKVDRVFYGQGGAAAPFNSAAVITKSDLINWYDDLPAPERNEVNSEAGLKNGKGKLPFPLQWDKAMHS